MKRDFSTPKKKFSDFAVNIFCLFHNCLFAVGAFFQGIADSNTCAQCLLNFRTTVFSGFARRQPCCTLQKQLCKNSPAHWVCEFRQSKFFARKGKSAVNSGLSINEHFNALLRKICLSEPHGVRVCYAYSFPLQRCYFQLNSCLTRV